METVDLQSITFFIKTSFLYCACGLCLQFNRTMPFGVFFRLIFTLTSLEIKVLEPRGILVFEVLWKDFVCLGTMSHLCHF